MLGVDLFQSDYNVGGRPILRQLQSLGNYIVGGRPIAQ